MPSTVYNIAKNTFRETVREPIYLLIILSSMVLISFYPWFSLFAFRQQVKMVVDSSMATTMVLGWVIAVLAASRTISGEINRGTALLLLSKPVPRHIFIIGKTAGILAALAVFWFLCALSVLISIRIASDQFWLDNKIWGISLGTVALGCVVGGVRNFARRTSFPMATVKALLVLLPVAAFVIYWFPDSGTWSEDTVNAAGFAWEVVPALILVLYSILAMGALATMLSTRLELVNNLIICAVVFTAGLMSDWLLGRFATDFWPARIAYACVPNWQLFWMADALAAKKAIPANYVFMGGAYVLLLICVFMFIANLMFMNREAGNQSPN